MEFLLISILLGIIQGAAEFLPVSSSGHLALFEAFFGDRLRSIENLTAFNLLLHLGTLAAVVLIYRRELWLIAKALPGALNKLRRRILRREAAPFTYDERLLAALCAATAPLVALKGVDLLLSKILGTGVLDLIDRGVTRSPVVVGALLLLNGALLFFSDGAGAPKVLPLDRLTPGKALAVGAWQTLAVLPGLSRSGCTVTGGRLSALGREDAVRFSFLLSVPAVLGSCASELPSAFSGGAFAPADLPFYAAATAAAFAAGLLSVRLLHLVAQRSTFRFFSFYCWGVGAAAIVCGLLFL